MKQAFRPGMSLVALIPALSVLLSLHTAWAEVEIGKRVPNFTLKDVDGKTHSLSDFKGKTVVLEWTNPNCPFVQRVYGGKIMPTVQKELTGKEVVWLAINSTNPDHGDFESASSLKETYEEWNAVFTALLLDPDGKVGKMFHARTTPHMFVITGEGTLAYDGAIDDDPRGSKSEKTNYIEAAFTDLNAGKNVSTSVTRPYGCSVKY
jgi:glutathione peroxidase-family protein